MTRSIVFDLGGTLMEYTVMPDVILLISKIS